MEWYILVVYIYKVFSVRNRERAQVHTVAKSKCKIVLFQYQNIITILFRLYNINTIIDRML